MAEYTEEQLNALIAEKVAEARRGLFTEEDLNRKVTSEVDRRVESGIQKGLETQRKKWEEEFAERAKMSAEELARKEFEEKQKEIADREKLLAKKGNTLDAMDMLTSASIPKSQYEKLIGVLVSDNSDVTKTNVQNFIDVFNSTKSEIESQIKAQFTKVPPPTDGNHSGAITKSEFDKMGYAEKMKFKTENPDLYKQYIK